MNELDKYGIRYKVEKTYPNGVRVGHVLDHTNKAKQRSMGQSWFPKSWTSKDIKRAGEHVANLKANRHVPDGKRIYGMWKGVRVGVIKTHGQIGTIFPDSKQPIKKGGKKMDINSFREVIKQREETDNEWDYGIEQCWKKEIEILSEDIPSTIEFLKNECTADEYSWISEVIDDVVDKVPSKELVQCYTELMAKFPEECQKYNIKGVIEICEGILKWEEENGKK